MSLPPHTKVIFFLSLLISVLPGHLNAQTDPRDTLKKVTADTIAADEGDDIDEKISYSAEDSVAALPEQGRVILYGKAKVVYGSMNMEADRLEVDYTTNIVKAYGRLDSSGKLVGNPTFRDGDETMEADTIKYNLKTKKGKIYNALTRQGELLVVGKEIKKDSTNIIYMRNMLCIPCQEEDARTGFRATKAKIIPDDKIVTGPMYLEVGGVPTPLGLPFGYFPNTKKQHNGILLPRYGRSESQGFFLQDLGYYWGISEMTDMILRADLYSNGSWKLGVNNNYNVLYKATGNTNVTYTEFNVGDKDVPSEFVKQKAYTVEWYHNQDNKKDPTVRFMANVNFRNNQAFNRVNAPNTGQFLTNTFQSNINYTKSFRLSSLSINATHNQNSITRQMDITFPSLTFNVNRFNPFRREGSTRPNVWEKIQVYYLAELKNTLSGKDSSIFMGSPVDSLRYGIRHTLPIQTNFNILKYIIATPAINLSSVMYGQSLRKDFIPTETHPGGTIVNRPVKRPVAGYDASFSTAFNTQVYFDYFFSRGRVTQVRHLMIPTLTYGYRPDFGEGHYGFWRSVQQDSLGTMRKYSIFERSVFQGPAAGKQNALNLSLNNTLEGKLKQRTDTGISFRKVPLIQNLNLNTSYNFAADSFKMGMINASMRTVLFKYFDVVTSANLDPYRFDDIRQRTLDQFLFEYDGRLARFTSANIAVNTAFGSNMIEAMRKTRKAPDLTNGAERGGQPPAAGAGPLPWDIRITYNLGLNRGTGKKFIPSHTANFAGSLTPTRYWTLGVTSGFDFTTQKISYTSLNVTRDLKCWQATIAWVPFGLNKNYSVFIGLKSSMLSDFKIPRQKPWFDAFL